MAERFNCFHCDEELDYRSFTRHRKEFYDSSTNTWQRRFVLSDSDSDHDVNGKPDEQQYFFDEINLTNNTSLQPQIETHEEFLPIEGRSSVKYWN